MDGNKDEALRCLKMAEESIASGNRDRALKFIKIASRLDPDLPFGHLLAACQDLGEGPTTTPTSSTIHSGTNFAGNDEVRVSQEKVSTTSFSSVSYSEEQVELIRQIKRGKDYYGILGVEKSCSLEEIRKAYKKLSLRVHPDKNKAPGADEAFKVVSKAFKCLSDGDSRRDYDCDVPLDGAGSDGGVYATGRRPVRRRRRRGSAHEFYYDNGDDLDPDEIFRSVFGQSGVFRTRNIYRNRHFGGGDYREEFQGGTRGAAGGGGPNLILLLQILPFLLIFALAYLPFSEPDYSLHRNYTYQISRITEKHGVEFFVKSSSFDESYPIGSPARAKVEDSVIKDYKNLLWRYCHVELQRRQWNKNLPTPHCNKLDTFGTA